MSPENQWLENICPIETGPLFRGHISVQGGNPNVELEVVFLV